MLEGIGGNFENVKLQVTNPDLANLLIWVCLLVLCAVWVKRKPLRFMEIEHTNQMRGLGILFVIVGHLWVHVAEVQPAIVLSGEGVSLFLFLSGYGLSRSRIINGFNSKTFVFGRIKLVLLPYWLATCFFLGADYLLLGRQYLTHDVLATFAGINVSDATRHLDYARWFVTFILFWYLMFWLSTLTGSQFLSLMFLSSAAGVLFLLDYYVMNLV